MNGKVAILARRSAVAVSGDDAAKWLDDLMTSDMPEREDAAAYGGLLSPQGKVLFDFIVTREAKRFLFDLPRTAVADFVKRLTLYKLRAKVEIAEARDRQIVAAWDGDAVGFRDPRLAALGTREFFAGPVQANASEAEYDAHRIALGIPEGGIDFAFGEVFPHDVDMDQVGGIDFKKGCYIGQEVVSRMEHRGTARRRFVIAEGAAPLPAPGTAVMAGDKPVGTFGSSVDGRGLALVRLDRAKEAMDAGVPITAGGATLTLRLPAWAHFTWPESAAADD